MPAIEISDNHFRKLDAIIYMKNKAQSILDPSIARWEMKGYLEYMIDCHMDEIIYLGLEVQNKSR